MGICCHFKAIDQEQKQNIEQEPGIVHDVLATESKIEDADIFDLEKSWHSLHILLSNTDNPTLKQTILGGKYIGTDIGFGPPRWLSPSEVCQVATALDKLTIDQLKEGLTEEFITTHFNPTIFPDRSQENIEHYLEPYFEGIKSYYGLASENGQGMLIGFA